MFNAYFNVVFLTIFTEVFFLSFMKRVFQLISLMDTGLPQCSNEKIELAILWFLDQFRKTYVGDQLQRTSKVGFY